MPDSTTEITAWPAVELTPAGAQVNVFANVAAPQHLWLPTARLDWQLTPKNTFVASYTGLHNSPRNIGVGGPALAETGYDSQRYDHTLRLSDVTNATRSLMHEDRVSFRWFGEGDIPSSTAPQVQVAGAFTGGGATLGPQHLSEFRLEIDDDIVLVTAHHTLKFGTQFFFNDEHRRLPTNFNGTYIFFAAEPLPCSTPPIILFPVKRQPSRVSSSIAVLNSASPTERPPLTSV